MTEFLRTASLCILIPIGVVLLFGIVSEIVQAIWRRLR